MFLYTKDKGTEKEFGEIIPFIIASNNIKCHGVTIQASERLMIKNFDSLKKEIEDQKTES